MTEDDYRAFKEFLGGDMSECLISLINSEEIDGFNIQFLKKSKKGYLEFLLKDIEFVEDDVDGGIH